LTLWLARACRTGFADESFDLVTLFHVAEHVTDLEAFSSVRILRPADALCGSGHRELAVS
jgi:2-polyprenyl-3-methyl-5-hydroxy-6-metoxy-1,4-benzoquinol methylase